MEYCEKCLNPLLKNETTVCKKCIDVDKVKVNTFTKLSNELNNYLRSHSNKTILYAFSGGRDSVVALYNLLRDCKKYNIQLKVFTIETGFKGKKTWENINNCIEFFDISSHFNVIDITNRLFSSSLILELLGKPSTVEEMYAYCFNNDILPCGKLCNSIIDSIYYEEKINNGVDCILTGGDTPKRNQSDEFSIFWEKPNGVTILRTGAAYTISKNKGAQLIEEIGIPWIDPKCGGYDTDCLLPGAIFYKRFNDENININRKYILENLPIIFDYVSERTRWSVIDPVDAQKHVETIDIASTESYNETVKMCEKFK